MAEILARYRPMQMRTCVRVRDPASYRFPPGFSVAEVARRTGLAYTTVTYHRERLRGVRQPARRAEPEERPVENFLVPVKTGGEVRRLLSAGHSRAEVARVLGIDKSTVTYHARRSGMQIDERPA